MAKTMVEGRLVGWQRLRCSAAGNPRYMLLMEGDREYPTEADGAVNYDVENVAGNASPARPKMVRLTISHRYVTRIESIEAVSRVIPLSRLTSALEMTAPPEAFTKDRRPAPWLVETFTALGFRIGEG